MDAGSRKYYATRYRSRPCLQAFLSDHSYLAVALGVLLQVAFFYVVFVPFPSMCLPELPPTSAWESAMALAVDRECDHQGLQGTPLPSDAVLTMMIAPDRERWLQYDTDDHVRRQIDTLAVSYRRLDRVALIVLTGDCSVRSIAHRVGLTTLKPESGTDIGDLTYNHAFIVIAKYAKTSIVGFASDTIIFTRTLQMAAEAIVEGRRRHDWADLFAVGVRRDVTLEPFDLLSLQSGEEHVQKKSWRDLMMRCRETGVPFVSRSADYFIWNQDWSGNWIDQPPFVLGGDGFDVWMIGWAQERGNTATINLTPVVEAYRPVLQQADDVRFAAEPSLATLLNSGVFHDHGMKGSGNVLDLHWVAARAGQDRHVEIVRQEPMAPSVNAKEQRRRHRGGPEPTGKAATDAEEVSAPVPEPVKKGGDDGALREQ